LNIVLENISFAYDRGEVLSDLNCSFESGYFYSIIGPNGSGKTTLLDLLSGFVKPARGRVLLNGAMIGAFSRKELARKIALVSQDYDVKFPFEVKDIVLMGRHPYIPRFSSPSGGDIERVNEVMETCGIMHLKNRRITELSGGERQRCVFARALCQDTRVLLLDEAFSNMDINHTLKMLSLIKRAVKEHNKIVINVFHDLNLASAWSDILLILDKGRIRAFGDSRNVLTVDIVKEVFHVDSVIEYNEHVRARQVYYPPV
jgi:iron complex transport system ATP-binding protein